MLANPPKRDAWPPYGDVRFVLVRSPGRLRPRRGLVLAWRRRWPHARRWEAYVAYDDDAGLEPGIRLAWLRPDQLIPVSIDPNWHGPEQTLRRGGGR